MKPLQEDKIGAEERVEGGVNVRKSECSREVGKEESEMEKEAWKLLRNAVVTYCGSPVGTVAANDPNDKRPLNYDQVFIRDFVPPPSPLCSRVSERLSGTSCFTPCSSSSLLSLFICHLYLYLIFVFEFWICFLSTPLLVFHPIDIFTSLSLDK